jgi:hypothetical protein
MQRIIARWLRCTTALGLALGLVSACSSRQEAAHPAEQDAGEEQVGEQDAGKGTDAGAPFEALAPNAYGSKIKTVMVGRALDDAELGALRDDPDALAGLIDGWMKDPAWRARLLNFFEQAFQQTQVSAADYDDQLGLKASAWRADIRARFERSAEQSFARTALALLDQGAAFDEVVRTRRFMLNPPLMAVLSYMDAVLQDDAGNPVRKSWLLAKYPNLTLVGDTTPVPLEQMVDPSSPNFFHFQYAAPAKAGCEAPVTAKGFAALVAMAGVMFAKNPNACGNGAPLFSDEDWDAWRMVTVRAPAPGDERNVFWDLPRLRQAKELVLDSPRVGFMTTPAFFANWPTNDSNQMRVTMNQTLIVALGTSFDDRDSTTPVTETTSDAEHVQPGTACYGCHKTLDPMRNFFRQSYNSFYSAQQDAKKADIPDTATFALGTSPVSGNGVFDLAEALVQNERFAIAWTQKLCRLANSASCAEDDPEFVRISTNFRQRGYKLDQLVRELFSSPLVTFASATQSSADGAVIGIQRRETLCGSLSQRLGLSDVCGLQGSSGLAGQAAQRAKLALNLAGSIPGDGYARGSEIPLMPHDPNLFFSSGVENLCVRLAAQVVDAQAGAKWTSADKAGALNGFLSVVMGVPASDERAPELRAVLSDHYDAALAQAKKPTDALRSAFVLACTSPLSISLGL